MKAIWSRSKVLVVVITLVVASLVGVGIGVDVDVAQAQDIQHTVPTYPGPTVDPEIEAAVIADGSARVLVEVDQSGAVESFVAMTVDSDGLDALRVANGVRSVRPNRAHRIELARSAPAIGAPEAWARGFTGAGQAVVVIDSGVDADHPFFSDDQGQSRVVEEACFSSFGVVMSDLVSTCNPTNPSDDDPTTSSGPGASLPCYPYSVTGCDHGTHVAGIAAGKGPTDGFDPRAPSGIAPSASIISINVFSISTDSGECGSSARTPCLVALDSDIIAALDYVESLRSSYSIAAVNMSLGGQKYPGSCDNQVPYTTRIDRLAADGIITVAASGNAGSSTEIATPACIESVVAVGSIDAATQAVSSFSNVSGNLDLFAPGTYRFSAGDGIVSSSSAGTYRSRSGTSMATPHVAGSLAVLREAKPSLTALQSVTVLKKTGVGVTDLRIPGGVTAPSVNLAAATADIRATGSFDVTDSGNQRVTVSGWVVDLDADTPVSVVVNVDGVEARNVDAAFSDSGVPTNFPGYGALHGMRTTIDVGLGLHDVCVTAIGIPDPAVRTVIGCRSVEVRGPSFALVTPASTRLSDGRLATFGAGSGGSVVVATEITPNGPWSGWKSLGVPVATVKAIAAGLDASGALNVFVVGGDGVVRYSTQRTPTTWSAWRTMATDASGGLEVGNSADGRIELFSLSRDGLTNHAWELPGGGFSAYIPTGAPIGTGLAVAANRDGRLEVFLRVIDGRLLNSWQVAPNSSWSGWSYMGAVSATSPVVVSNSDGRLELFATFSDGTLIHSWQWRAGSAWSGWDTMGATSATKPVVVRNLDGRLEIFVSDQRGSLIHSWQWRAGSSWSGWDAMGIQLPGPPRAAIHGDGRLVLFAVNVNGSMVFTTQIAANSPWGAWSRFPR